MRSADMGRFVSLTRVNGFEQCGSELPDRINEGRPRKSPRRNRLPSQRGGCRTIIGDDRDQREPERGGSLRRGNCSAAHEYETCGTDACLPQSAGIATLIEAFSDP